MKIARACVCCGGNDLVRSPAVLMPFLAARIFGWESVAITPDWGLRDLACGHAHALCSTLACADCGLIFLDMRFDDAEMTALYADYRGPDYQGERERFEPGYGARNAALNAGYAYIPEVEAWLAPHLPARALRVLDWGGDTGLNTPFADRAALHHVHDISGKPLVAGAERIDPAAPRSEAYDLVVCAQVLEHLPAPGAVVAAMAAAMGRETLLYVEVPHEALMRAEADHRARGARKRHWHEHVNFFTEDALRALLVGSGLRVDALRSHPVTVEGRQAHILSAIARREAADGNRT